MGRPVASASFPGQRAAILAGPLSEFTGFMLVVDCLASGCGGERTYAVADLAAFYGARQTVGAAWLTTGPILNARVRPRRVALLGSEARK